jgi:hypothetical protein
MSNCGDVVIGSGVYIHRWPSASLDNLETLDAR